MHRMSAEAISQSGAFLGDGRELEKRLSASALVDGALDQLQQHQPESVAGCWPRNTKAVNKAAAGAAMISVQPA